MRTTKSRLGILVAATALLVVSLGLAALGLETWREGRALAESPSPPGPDSRSWAVELPLNTIYKWTHPGWRAIPPAPADVARFLYFYIGSLVGIGCLGLVGSTFLFSTALSDR